MNSKFLPVAALIIAVVALVVSIAAFNKAGGQADVRETIEPFKSDIETTANNLRKTRAESVAQMETKLQLVKAKANLLSAKMHISLENNYNKAAEELSKAANNLEKARTKASEGTKEKIMDLKAEITEAEKYVGDKSAQAIEKVIELLKKTEQVADSLGEASSK